MNGKYKRVYDANGNVNKEIYLLDATEYQQCGLRVPSFIDCSKSYCLNLDSSFDVTRLSNRTMPGAIVNKINTTISNLKSAGMHIQYNIKVSDFKNLNPNCVIY